jgi:hypothetical protein
MNQTQAVLAWMRSHTGITSMEAFRELGVTRLSDKVFNLRAKGHDIRLEWCETRDRFGHRTRFARYHLHE